MLWSLSPPWCHRGHRAAGLALPGAVAAEEMSRDSWKCWEGGEDAPLRCQLGLETWEERGRE